MEIQGPVEINKKQRIISIMLFILVIIAMVWIGYLYVKISYLDEDKRALSTIISEYQSVFIKDLWKNSNAPITLSNFFPSSYKKISETNVLTVYNAYFSFNTSYFDAGKYDLNVICDNFDVWTFDSIFLYKENPTIIGKLILTPNGKVNVSLTKCIFKVNDIEYYLNTSYINS